jgi:hypothetical protein
MKTTISTEFRIHKRKKPDPPPLILLKEYCLLPTDMRHIIIRLFLSKKCYLDVLCFRLVCKEWNDYICSTNYREYRLATMSEGLLDDFFVAFCFTMKNYVALICGNVRISIYFMRDTDVVITKRMKHALNNKSKRSMSDLIYKEMLKDESFRDFYDETARPLITAKNTLPPIKPDSSGPVVVTFISDYDRVNMINKPSGFFEFLDNYKQCSLLPFFKSDRLYTVYHGELEQFDYKIKNMATPLVLNNFKKILRDELYLPRKEIS